MQIPVYVFTGFIKSGKTKFIQETFEDERFNDGTRTLLLVCEKGREQYDSSTYPHACVYLEQIEQEKVTTEELDALQKKHHAKRVVVEPQRDAAGGRFLSENAPGVGSSPRRSCLPTVRRSRPSTPIAKPRC